MTRHIASVDRPRPRAYLRTTIAEPFPLLFGHVGCPTESHRETACGPYYSAPFVRHDSTEHAEFVEWRASTLRERGWSVRVESVVL